MTGGADSSLFVGYVVGYPVEDNQAPEDHPEDQGHCDIDGQARVSPEDGVGAEPGSGVVLPKPVETPKRGHSSADHDDGEEVVADTPDPRSVFFGPTSSLFDEGIF